jgi:hypothetical protein
VISENPISPAVPEMPTDSAVPEKVMRIGTHGQKSVSHPAPTSGVAGWTMSACYAPVPLRPPETVTLTGAKGDSSRRIKLW